MIGSLVEYTGIYKSLHGKRAIVIRQVASVFRQPECAWQVMWVHAVDFAGRRTVSSKLPPSEFIVVSEVQS
jgi:hypothetical protein